MAGKQMTPASGGLTSGSPSRMQAAAPDSTKAASAVRNPGRGAATPASVGAGEMAFSMSEHTRPAVVTGPRAWENGRDRVSTPAGRPPLRGTKAAGADPCK